MTHSLHPHLKGENAVVFSKNRFYLYMLKVEAASFLSKRNVIRFQIRGPVSPDKCWKVMCMLHLVLFMEILFIFSSLLKEHFIIKLLKEHLLNYFKL